LRYWANCNHKDKLIENCDPENKDQVIKEFRELQKTLEMAVSNFKRGTDKYDSL
jgi:hypothetical protein